MLNSDVVTYFTRPRSLLILLVVVLSGTAWAQRCTGFVSVDGALLEDGAACYFGDAEGAREKTLSILAIVEEDIKDMST